MSKFSIATAIAYVNAGPHIGHALEFVQADVLARYHRIQGEEVFFLTGTDEHGQKIAQVAESSGMSPKALANQNSAQMKALCEKLNISFDHFIRTTDEIHLLGAQKMWKALKDADALYTKDYEGLYCVGCEAFLTQKDLVDGLCEIHKKAPELVREKNYFFKLSRYSEEILKLVESDVLKIVPSSRRNEFLSLCRDGLHDVSFSRPKTALSWGIPVPDDENQVMYVWCDALSNYLTALGYAENHPNVQKYWPTDVNLIGKDILRFHAGVWVGMLLAAQLPIPKSIYVHGFITHDGHKMSKSLGNVVDPFQALESWGRDPLRYYLLREVPTTEDGDYSEERFKVLYQDDLANTMGNLIRRVISMSLKSFESRRPKGNGDLSSPLKRAEDSVKGYLHAFDIKKALESILELARFGNLYVDQEKPWELKKTNPERLEPVLGNLLDLCEHIGKLLAPFLPETSEKILMQIGKDEVQLGDLLFPNRQDSL